MKRNSTSVNTRRLYSCLYQLGHVARCDCDISWGEKIIEVRFKCIWIWQEGVELQVRYWNKYNFSKSMISSLSKPLLPFSRNKSGSDWSFVESFLSSKKSWITFSKAATLLSAMHIHFYIKWISTFLPLPWIIFHKIILDNFSQDYPF